MPTSPTPKLSPQTRRTLIVMTLIAACGMMGVDIHLASMPHIMQDLHTDKPHMQQSVAMYLLGLAISILFYGPVSDKFGRKPVILFGLTLASISSIASIYSQTIGFFLMTRLFQGLGAGVCNGLGRTVVADLLQGERLAITGSYFSMVVNISPVIAPAIGGFVQHHLGWHANFILLALILALSALLFATFCDETNQSRDQHALSLRHLFTNYAELLTHPVFMACTLLTGIAWATNTAYATTSAFILQMNFHLSALTYGWLTALVGMGTFAGKLCSPMLIRHIGRLGSLQFSVCLISLAGIFLLATIALGQLGVGFLLGTVFFTLLAQAVITPSALSYALDPFPGKRGIASALYGSILMLIAFFSSAIIASFAHGGTMILALAYVILGGSGIVVCRSLLAGRVPH